MSEYCKNCFELVEKLAEKEQEYKDLKFCTESLSFKYKKCYSVLEEIEKIVKINCEEICGRKFEDCNDFLCSSKNILDIINKAKGK